MTKQEQLTAKLRELEELEAKQAELKAEIVKLERGWQWVPVRGDRYRCVDIMFPCWKDSPIDHCRLSAGNVFRWDDRDGAENHKLFQRSILPSCAFEDVTHIVWWDGATYSRCAYSEGDVRSNYLLGRGADSFEKAEAWIPLYHEVQVRKCGG